MPTKKPVLQAVMEQSVYMKFLEICKAEDRTPSKQASRVITEYVSRYEDENGEICIK